MLWVSELLLKMRHVVKLITLREVLHVDTLEVNWKDCELVF